jgi:hypothetical protein
MQNHLCIHHSYYNLPSFYSLYSILRKDFCVGTKQVNDYIGEGPTGIFANRFGARLSFFIVFTYLWGIVDRCCEWLYKYFIRCAVVALIDTMLRLKASKKAWRLIEYQKRQTLYLSLLAGSSELVKPLSLFGLASSSG